MEAVTEIVSALGGWAEAGGFVFGGICFFAVIFGWLMPRRSFISVEKDRDTYREALETKDKALAEKDKLINFLSRHVGETIVQTFEGLPTAEEIEQIKKEEQVEDKTKIDKIQLLKALRKWRL